MKHLTEKLSLSKSTIWLWVRNNEFPKPNKINGVSVWKKDAIDQWINENINKEEES
jgi:predicted DNA-binding transcriptional regulator AlpA